MPRDNPTKSVLRVTQRPSYTSHAKPPAPKATFSPVEFSVASAPNRGARKKGGIHTGMHKVVYCRASALRFVLERLNA